MDMNISKRVRDEVQFEECKTISKFIFVMGKHFGPS